MENLWNVVQEGFILDLSCYGKCMECCTRRIREGIQCSAPIERFAIYTVSHLSLTEALSSN